MTEEFIGCIEEELKEIELFYEENGVEVEAYTFTCPFSIGAVSHLIMAFPTLFSSHTTDIVGEVPEHDGSTSRMVSQFNRFLYIVSLSDESCNAKIGITVRCGNSFAIISQS